MMIVVEARPVRIVAVWVQLQLQLSQIDRETVYLDIPDVQSIPWHVIHFHHIHRHPFRPSVQACDRLHIDEIICAAPVPGRS